MHEIPMPQVLTELADCIQSLSELCGAGGQSDGRLENMIQGGSAGRWAQPGSIASAGPAVQPNQEAYPSPVAQSVLVAQPVHAGGLGIASDAGQVLAVLSEVSRISRLADGLLVQLAGIVDKRTQKGRGVDVTESFAHSQGYKTAQDLLRQVTGASGSTVRGWLNLAGKLAGLSGAFSRANKAAGTDVLGSGSPGRVLTGPEQGGRAGTVGQDSTGGNDGTRGYSHMRDALQAGKLHIDAARVVARKLATLPPQVPDEHVQAAELVLISHAIGEELVPGTLRPQADELGNAGVLQAGFTPEADMGLGSANPKDGLDADVGPGQVNRGHIGGGQTGDSLANGSPADGDRAGGGKVLGVHADDLHVLADGLLAQVRTLNELPFEHDGAKRGWQRNRGVDAADRERYFQIGATKGGLTYFHGATYPEVAAALSQLLDSQTNPRVKKGAWASGGNTGQAGVDDAEIGVGGAEAGVGSTTAGSAVGSAQRGDSRTMRQRQHDAFASILRFVLDHPERTHLGGQGVSLMIHVKQDEYLRPNGTAFVKDSHGEHSPIESHIARHVGCVGSVKKIVTGPAGDIVALHSTERIFPAALREAIVARDGQCVIPGCGIKASWCEVHHVQEWQHHGQTSVDNGVLLCWYHHRNLEKHGWGIRIEAGIPLIKAPKWLNSQQAWQRPPMVHDPPDLKVILARIRKAQTRLKQKPPQAA